MNVFRVLHTQVKRALLEESRLSEDERRQFQWQFLATVGSTTYLVGKGGANTCFYRVGEQEMQYCHPQPLLDIIKSWGGSKYAVYTIVRNKPGNGLAGPFPDLEMAKDYIPDEDEVDSGTVYIVGHTPDNKSKRLFVLTPSLKGYSWKKFVQGEKPKQAEEKPRKRRRRRRKT
jgi:hypothetical protein